MLRGEDPPAACLPSKINNVGRRYVAVGHIDLLGVDGADDCVEKSTTGLHRARLIAHLHKVAALEGRVPEWLRRKTDWTVCPGWTGTGQTTYHTGAATSDVMGMFRRSAMISTAIIRSSTFSEDAIKLRMPESSVVLSSARRFIWHSAFITAYACNQHHHGG